MKHVLVPYDESPLSEHALEHALAEHGEAEITLLHALDFVEAGYSASVETSLPGYWEAWYENAQDDAEALFEDAQATAAESDTTVETETVVGQPARSIVEYTEENPVDHVVMGSHGRSGISRLLVGSVAETVLRRAPCPVTVVR